MIKSILHLTIIISAIFFLHSCKEEDPQPEKQLEAITVSNLEADPTLSTNGQPKPATGKFTLFSFKENTTVINTDSATSKWDIGFRGTTIIINGGAIRTGEGGAYIHTGLFDELTEITSSQIFDTDDTATDLAIPTGSGNGWYNYDGQNNWISPIAGRVLVIKTGDGKYAKVEIMSYYKDSPKEPSATALPRHYTFKYIYQPNGGMKF